MAISLHGCPGVKDLQIVVACTFLHQSFLIAFRLDKLNTSYAGLIFLSHIHTDTQKQSPLTPVQVSQAFSPESHCFELTALPH